MSKNKLEEVQTERGSVYGGFDDHSKAVDQIMEILRDVNRKKNNSKIPVNGQPFTDWPTGFETAVFYMVSKLVRLATTPTHVDSALDLSSYSDLWLKIIIHLEEGSENEASN